MTSNEALTAHPLRQVRIGKVVLNIAVGKSGEPLEKAKKVLTQLTGRKPATRRAKRAVKDFGVRKGEPIAAIVTLRRQHAAAFLSRALEAVGNKLERTSFDTRGNMSFGVKEHIEIPGTKYVPELGIFGATISVALERPGYRVRRRAIGHSQIGRAHIIGRDEAVEYIRNNFRTQVPD